MYRGPFSDMRWGFQQEAHWRPPTDVYESGDSAVVIVEIAGLREGDFEVTLTGRALIVTGERHDPGSRQAYQQMEIRYGRFRTQVYLPWALNTDDVQVEYQNGFLKVVLQKAKTHRIPVKVVQEPDAEERG